MPTPTYVPLANTVLTGDALDVSFSNIDQSYRDLVIVVEGYVTTRTSQVLTFNGDTTYTNYHYVYMLGNGSSPSTSSGNSYITNEVFENSSTNRTVMRIEIFDYTATDKHKAALIRADNAYPNGSELRAYRWANTSAISSLSLTPTGSSWGTGTSFTMYGIAS